MMSSPRRHEEDEGFRTRSNQLLLVESVSSFPPSPSAELIHSADQRVGGMYIKRIKIRRTTTDRQTFSHLSFLN
jgi:hypothetical protein